MRAISVFLAVWLAFEQCVVAALALWPIGADGRAMLARARGWAALYRVGTSNLDVWLLSAAHAAVVLLLLLLAAPSSAPAGSRSRGATTRQPARRADLGLRVASGAAALLLLGKAVAVAILAPDGLAPPPLPVGAVGLACMFAAVAAAFVGSGVTGLLARRVVLGWEEEGKGAGAEAAAAAAERKRAVGVGDEEAGLAVPLLGSSSGGGGDSSSGGGGGDSSSSGGGTARAADGKQQLQSKQRGAAGGSSGGAKRKKGTVGELLLLSVPDAPILLAAFAAGAGAALMAGLVPYYTGLIVDFASIDPSRARFDATVLKLLAVAAAGGALTGARGGLFSVCMTRLNVRLRRSLFSSLLAAEAAFFDANKTGEITSRLAADCSTVSDAISLNLNIAVRSATQAAVVLAFMFAASWRLTVVTFVLVPLVLLVSKVYGLYYRRLSKRVQEALAQANAVAEETLGAMPTVRAHAAQDGARAAYGARLDVFYGLQRREALAYSLYAATTTFLPSCVAAAVLFYGGSLVLCGRMSPGALVAFMLYQQSLSGAFSTMGDVFSALSAAVGAADKVIELMRREPALPPPGGLAPAALEGAVEFRGVKFSYPSRPGHTVLDGLWFSVRPGEVVALVGPSGGGKSSVIKLLQRFYDPDEGSVLIDGRPVACYDPKWLRRHMALVSQEPVLFARSVKRNICYGLEPDDGAAASPSQEEVEAAARLANAHGFITEQFPDGYDTECGEKGLSLSGGQKQRVAIARALVRRPQLLLLDEATSALDSDSEAVVQDALDRVMSGRTVIVVAHRLSTIQGADRIVVVQGGRVAEAGTHEELVAAGGAYAKLVARQLRGGPSTASLSGGGGGGGSGGGGSGVERRSAAG